MRFKLKNVKCPKCGVVLTDVEVMRLVESGFPETVFAVYYDKNGPERLTIPEARVDAVKIWDEMYEEPGFENEIPVVWQLGDRCGHVEFRPGHWIWYDYFTDTYWEFDSKTGELIERME